MIPSMRVFLISGFLLEFFYGSERLVIHLLMHSSLMSLKQLQS